MPCPPPLAVTDIGWFFVYSPAQLHAAVQEYRRYLRLYPTDLRVQRLLQDAVEVAWLRGTSIPSSSAVEV